MSTLEETTFLIPVLPPRRSCRRVICLAACAGILTFLLWTDARRQPGDTVVGRLCGNYRQSGSHGQWRSLYVYRQRGQIDVGEAVLPNSIVGDVDTVTDVDYFGLWSPVFSENKTGINIRSYDSDISPDEYARVQELMIRRVGSAARGDLEFRGPIVAVRGTRFSAVMIEGIGEDAAVFAGLFALWACLKSLPKAWHQYREARQLHSRFCHKCRYDLVGLPTPRCPECGHLNITRWHALPRPDQKRAAA